MNIPLWSIVTLLTELAVSTFVYFILYDAYVTGRFRRHLALAVLAYEVIFNISYMLSRLLVGTHEGATQVYTPYETGLAIFHGTFSLIMFLALIAFFMTAMRCYVRGENYFRTHKGLTITFSVAWAVSVLSGILFFVQLYLL